MKKLIAFLILCSVCFAADETLEYSTVNTEQDKYITATHKPFSYRRSAIDLDGDDLIFKATDLPEGMVLTSKKVGKGLYIWSLEWRKPVDGIHCFSISVSDGELSDTWNFECVKTINHTPKIVPVIEANEGAR